MDSEGQARRGGKSAGLVKISFGFVLNAKWIKTLGNLDFSQAKRKTELLLILKAPSYDAPKPENIHPISAQEC